MSLVYFSCLIPTIDSNILLTIINVLFTYQNWKSTELWVTTWKLNLEVQTCEPKVPAAAFLRIVGPRCQSLGPTAWVLVRRRTWRWGESWLSSGSSCRTSRPGPAAENRRWRGTTPRRQSSRYSRPESWSENKQLTLLETFSLLKSINHTLPGTLNNFLLSQEHV